MIIVIITIILIQDVFLSIINPFIKDCPPLLPLQNISMATRNMIEPLCLEDRNRNYGRGGIETSFQGDT